ncbi:hypothetical protein PRZ48_008386 [Zasmidium cellare]|uniref:Zn(2)-C6 fungal-type domain-containing protein n=1 Tax=Zasmidium cellare TaxID=395010 RepID=A0ABR0EFY6_ZASCE|nr:hypothetical protein PRZ48_008386 [Zasmidium cellare]
MPAQNDASRKRKAHTKSRQGCGNCKLRRVKCDETRPKCKKCTAFGVSCDYDSKASDLAFSGVGSFQVDIPKPPTPPESPPDGNNEDIEAVIEGMMNAPLYLHVDEGTPGPQVCYIDKPHLDLLRKFYNRTVLSIGTAGTKHIYRGVMTRMAAQHSFVLHAILRFTLIHDRYLYDPLGTKPSTAEAFHGYHAAALFGKKLQGPVAEEEKDALWGIAAILGASSFASIEASKAEEAWPLKEPELGDLDWLKMSDGKREVWKIADPLRPTSVFRAAIEFENNRKDEMLHRPTDPELDSMFPWVTKLFNLDAPRSEDDPKDPYFEAASIIERLVPIECTHSTVMWFLSFLGHMNPEYRRLLEAKDPPAMLLLSWWYAKLINYDQWWLRRRVLFECQAIVIYLDRELSDDDEMKKLLEFPKSRCGLDRGDLGRKDFPEHRRSESFPWPRNF